MDIRISAGCKGFTKEDRVIFLEEIVQIDFLVLAGAMVDIPIGLVDLKRLQATLGLGRQFADYIVNNKPVRVLLKSETDKFIKTVALDEDKYFSTELSFTDDSSLSDFKVEDLLVISLVKDIYGPKTVQDEADLMFRITIIDGMFSPLVRSVRVMVRNYLCVT